MQKIQKTIKCKIHKLTNIKEQVLQSECDDYQTICQGIQECVDNDIEPEWVWFKTKERHCSYLSGAKRTVTKQFTNLKDHQPLYLRNDVFDIEEQPTKISKHWLRLPTKQKHGGVWLPIIVPKKHEHLLDNKVCDSKITKDKKGIWYAHITVQKEISRITIPQNPTILAVDLGERYSAVTASVAHDGTVNEINFYGKEIRGIRRHYAWLRKHLGNKKLRKVIRQVGHTEKRKVNDVLHKISRAIVNEAKKRNAIILLGDLKDIRKSAKGKGKRFNRIVANMPSHKLSGFIEYKALWDGVPTIKDKEYGTSITCHVCKSRGKRLSQARFRCDNCGLDYFNADVNATLNQATKGLSAIRGETGPTGSARNSGGGGRNV